MPELTEAQAKEVLNAHHNAGSGIYQNDAAGLQEKVSAMSSLSPRQRRMAIEGGFAGNPQRKESHDTVEDPSKKPEDTALSLIKPPDLVETVKALHLEDGKAAIASITGALDKLDRLEGSFQNITMTLNEIMR